MALIYFDPYPKIPIIQGRGVYWQNDAWISKEGSIAQIY